MAKASEEHAETAQRLRKALLALEMSGAAMAKALGIPQQTWDTYVSNTNPRRFPTRLARQLRRKFGISMDWLYGDPAEESNNTEAFNKKLRRIEAGPAPNGGPHRSAHL